MHLSVTNGPAAVLTRIGTAVAVVEVKLLRMVVILVDVPVIPHVSTFCGQATRLNSVLGLLLWKKGWTVLYVPAEELVAFK